jgi:hypothetical protein
VGGGTQAVCNGVRNDACCARRAHAAAVAMAGAALWLLPLLGGTAHQVQVIKLDAVGVGCRGVYRHLHAIYFPRRLLQHVHYDAWVPAVRQCMDGASLLRTMAWTMQLLVTEPAARMQELQLVGTFSDPACTAARCMLPWAWCSLFAEPSVERWHSHGAASHRPGRLHGSYSPHGLLNTTLSVQLCPTRRGLTVNQTSHPHKSMSLRAASALCVQNTISML